jgi:hypothetical protein
MRRKHLLKSELAALGFGLFALSTFACGASAGASRTPSPNFLDDAEQLAGRNKEWTFARRH